MDPAPREIRWLKRIMKELGDEREAANKRDLATNQQMATSTAARALTHEDDDSELDRLLHRAMLLLRSRASNNQLSAVSVPDNGEEEEDGDDDELDQLLQRALKLLREQLTKNNECSSSKETQSVAVVPEQEDEDDDELDRSLHHAMLLFAERRQRSLGCDDAETAELDVLWLKSIQSAASPVSPVLTDYEDEEDEEDDELDELLHRAMTLKVPQEQSRKRPHKDEAEAPSERKSKRVRCLVELQQEAQTEPEQTEERSSFDTTASTLEAAQSSASWPAVEQPAHCVTPASEDRVSEQPQLTCHELELQTLPADNTKLVAENADLHQKLRANNSSDSRLVLLLQEQVQRLQQRELELMRDLALEPS